MPPSLSCLLGQNCLEKPLLLFVIHLDKFFVSHFLPLARQAVAEGYVCWIACQVTDKQRLLEEVGLHVLPLPLTRPKRSLNTFLKTALVLRRILNSHKFRVIHAIGLEALVLSVLSSNLCRIGGQYVLAPTGLGYFDSRTLSWRLRTVQKNGQISFFQHFSALFSLRSLYQKIGRGIIQILLRYGVPPSTKWIFENSTDAHTLLGSRLNEVPYLIVGGAGVDVQTYTPSPLPFIPPFRIAFVGRMLFSKGIDLVVEAVRILRGEGFPILLTLVGAPDDSNPSSIPLNLLQDWQKPVKSADEPCIIWIGPRQDIPAVWAEHHLHCLPSLGGEGLPKSLLEAAACARPSITTNVPGCRDFVHNEMDGYIIEAGDLPALVAVLRSLLEKPEKLFSLGQAARAHVVAHHTDKKIAQQIVHFYHLSSKYSACA